MMCHVPVEETNATLPIPSLEIEEDSARKSAAKNVVYLLMVNSYSAVFVFAFHLISLESWVSIALSVGMTLYTYYKTIDNTSFEGTTMSWVLLSFAVIAPIGSALTMAFSRRDLALQQTAILRSTFLQLYIAHAIWDWNIVTGGATESGRSKSTVRWIDHSDATIQDILNICDALTRLLTLPNSSRARHKVMRSGRKEATKTHSVHLRFTVSISSHFGSLAEKCEILKREGLPPNEASRVRQWEQNLVEAIEKLYTIKKYRTPQGLRSFARLFSVLLPPFYAPYYAQLAHDTSSLGTAVTFSVLTSLALTALFETISQLEDPFVDSSILDGVDMQQELLDDFKPQLLAVRQRFFGECIAFAS